MKVILLSLLPVALTVLACVSCGRGFGHASEERDQQQLQPPEAVSSFNVLYQQHCAGCHGADGQNGPATNLANSEYEALIDDDMLRDIIANGQKQTMMPGFAKSAGGELTDQQVTILVRGMRKQWSKGNLLQGTGNPPYKAVLTGDAERGKQVYASDCARCHGREGGPPGDYGSILDNSFLGLISDQTVRTTAIVGRPDLGMPDFRGQVAGRALTDQDITDVVAFVISKRPRSPGSPNSEHQMTSGSAADNREGRP